jgi:hypothetical protein
LMEGLVVVDNEKAVVLEVPERAQTANE